MQGNLLLKMNFKDSNLFLVRQTGKLWKVHGATMLASKNSFADNGSVIQMQGNLVKMNLRDSNLYLVRNSFEL